MLYIRKIETIGFILGLIIFFGLAACQPENPEQMSDNSPVVTIAPLFEETLLPTTTPALKMEEVKPTDVPAEPVGPDKFPDNVNPLTGLEASDPELLNRRPLMVKIQNAPRDDRPAWGLSLADHVIEYYLEYGYTRFAAVFYGNNPDMIGPIRSARHADLHLVNMYDATFVYGGAYRELLDLLIDSEFQERIFQEGPNTSPALYRYEPAVKNYLVLHPADLPAVYEYYGTDNTRQNLDGMRFAGKRPDGGVDVQRIFTRFSPVSYSYWQFDDDRDQFRRFEENLDDFTGQSESYTPASDRLTGEPVYADNVVIVFVAYEQLLENDQVFDIHLQGEGNALIARTGKLYQATWSRPGREKILQFTDENGDPFAFQPGKTWILLFNLDSELLGNDNETRINFIPPEFEGE